MKSIIRGEDMQQTRRVSAYRVFCVSHVSSIFWAVLVCGERS